MEASNIKALREALEDSQQLLESFLYGECGSQVREQMRDNRAALSAPPRNCDRFKHELDAQIAFLNKVWLISVDKDTMLERDRFENWTDEMRMAYAKWLFAPAEEGGMRK